MTLGDGALLTRRIPLRRPNRHPIPRHRVRKPERQPLRLVTLVPSDVLREHIYRLLAVGDFPRRGAGAVAAGPGGGVVAVEGVG